MLERLATITDTEESSANSRLTAWATALEMIKSNPFWGVGLRNFLPRVKEYSVVPLAPDDPGHVAHNSYLQIWAESGTIAFVVYMVLLASVFLLKVVPWYTYTFQEFDVDLPQLTRWLVYLSDLTVAYWFLLIPAFLVIDVAVLLLTRGWPRAIWFAAWLVAALLMFGVGSIALHMPMITLMDGLR